MANFKDKEDLILEKIIDNLKERFTGNIISIYGIGSYFDDSLPSDWIKKDLDLIVIVRSLKSIPKPDWTEVRYEKKKFDDYEVWLAFNTIDAYQDKEKFEKQSFSNYEWSLLDLKIPDNSILLYGEDIRVQLPDISKIKFDFDDILARSFYHFDNSFKEAIESKNIKESMREFTKGTFKFGFYLCIYFDKSFSTTSIRAIANKIEELTEKNILDKIVLNSIKESILFRRTNKVSESYIKLRNNFLLSIFSLIGKGKLHRKMNFNELISFLENTFRGLKYMIKFTKNLKKKYFSLRTETE